MGKKMGAEGAKHVADSIATNTTLKKLKYALSYPQPCCQGLLTSPLVFPLQSRAERPRSRRCRGPLKGPCSQQGPRLAQVRCQLTLPRYQPLNTMSCPSFAGSRATTSVQRGQRLWPTPSRPTPPSRSSSMRSAPQPCCQCPLTVLAFCLIVSATTSSAKAAT